MIRFGKFEDSYGFKTDADPNHRIFPIPTTALSTNPNFATESRILIFVFIAHSSLNHNPRGILAPGFLLLLKNVC